MLSCDQFTVEVEGKVLNTTTSFLMAFWVMFAPYYVFNLEYPDSVRCTLKYFQRNILKISHENEKLPPKLLTFMSKIGAVSIDENM